MCYHVTDAGGHGGVERMIKKLRMSHPSISFRQEFVDLHPVPWLALIWGAHRCAAWHELLVRTALSAVTDAHSHRLMQNFVLC